MNEKMPSPYELERIQKENLTEEQIAKDKEREAVFEQGIKKGFEQGYKKAQKEQFEDGEVQHYIEKILSGFSKQPEFIMQIVKKYFFVYFHRADRFMIEDVVKDAEIKPSLHDVVNAALLQAAERIHLIQLCNSRKIASKESWDNGVEGSLEVMGNNILIESDTIDCDKFLTDRSFGGNVYGIMIRVFQIFSYENNIKVSIVNENSLDTNIKIDMNGDGSRSEKEKIEELEKLLNSYYPQSLLIEFSIDNNQISIDLKRKKTI